MPIYALDGIAPTFADRPSNWIAPDATLIGKISIGRDVSIWFGAALRGDNELIEIGEGSRINNGFTAIAETTAVVIGKRCLVGPSVTVFDSDFHGMHVHERNNTAAIARAPVHIGDDVFIGARAIILKGVTIGDGSVIAAGSVVVGRIPGGVIAGGNPARVIREI